MIIKKRRRFTWDDAALDRLRAAAAQPDATMTSIWREMGSIATRDVIARHMAALGLPIPASRRDPELMEKRRAVRETEAAERAQRRTARRARAAAEREALRKIAPPKPRRTVPGYSPFVRRRAIAQQHGHRCAWHGCDAEAQPGKMFCVTHRGNATRF